MANAATRHANNVKFMKVAVSDALDGARSASELAAWLPGALAGLSDVAGAALTFPTAGPNVSKADRLSAVRKTVDELKAGLLARLEAALSDDNGADVAKRTGTFAGWL